MMLHIRCIDYSIYDKGWEPVSLFKNDQSYSVKIILDIVDTL